MSAAAGEASSFTNDGVEGEARALGWRPKEEFKGEESKWVDADTYVERGKTVLPLVKRENANLTAAMQRQQGQIDVLTRQLQASQQDFSTLQEFHNEEVTRRVEETRRELKAQIKAARESDDVDGEIDATDKLQQLNTANKAAEDAIKAAKGEQIQTGVQQPEITREAVAWFAKNPWFQSDAGRTYEALALGHKIIADSPHLKGDAFYAELDKRMSGDALPGRSKVEGSRGGATGGGQGGRTYADLPADAKSACDKYAKRFVKPDGQFKTVAEYRTHYVRQLEEQDYFRQGQ